MANRKLKKIYKSILRIYETGNLDGLTPSELNEVGDCFNSLFNGETATTLLNGVANYFNRFGFKVLSNGIAYRISI